LSAWSQQLRALSLPGLVARAAGWLIAPEGEAEARSVDRDTAATPAARGRHLSLAEPTAAPAARHRHLHPADELDGPAPAARHRHLRPADELDGPTPSPPGSVPSGGSRPPLALAPSAVSAPEPSPPVVAVVGLAPGAGASTVARAVAARLADEDPCGAAILVTPDPPRTGLATAAASRLARTLADHGTDGPRATGRLCLVDASEPLAPIAAQRSAPLVADIAHGAPTEGAVALAHHVVLVCAPDVEPALTSAVESALRGAGHSVSLVLNRVVGEPPPGLEHALEVPESRLAAQLTLACREPRGALAAVAVELAERSLEEAWL
jgi:hypothetical protein